MSHAYIPIYRGRGPMESEQSAVYTTHERTLGIKDGFDFGASASRQRHLWAMLGRVRKIQERLVGASPERVVELEAEMEAIRGSL